MISCVMCVPCVMTHDNVILIISPDGDTMSFDGSVSFLYLSTIEDMSSGDGSMSIILFPFYDERKKRKLVWPNSGG